jgi:peroxidase
LGDILPFNDSRLPNDGGDSERLFLAGDVRANEQAGLTSLHIIFVREHNRLVGEIESRNPKWSAEQVFQKARQLVGAQMQVITYREFLPTLLGRRALSRYEGYKPEVTSGIANEFSAAAYRFGHSALSSTLLRINADGTEFVEGHLAQRDAFFNPSILVNEQSLEPILRGLAVQVCQQIDVKVVDDVRNFLFGAPPNTGFDLAALNIQRGRDHGLSSYNDTRRALGFEPVISFSDITSDADVEARLATAYESVEDIDLWVGGLAEDHLEEGHLGESFATIVAFQFEALRDGDRFWYQRTLKRQELDEIEQTRLSDIIRRNTSIGDELRDNVFRVTQEPDFSHNKRSLNLRE